MNYQRKTRNFLHRYLTLIVLLAFILTITLTSYSPSDTATEMMADANTTENIETSAATEPMSACEIRKATASKINTYPVQNTSTDCFCDVENFCFPAGVNSWGKRFDCQWLPYLKKLKLIGHTDDWSSKNEEEERVPFEDKDFVFVTYSSSNHFKESYQSLRVLRAASNNTIVYYDIGLEDVQVTKLKKIPNLEYRKFAFERYPDLIRQLKSYTFKAIVTAEMLANKSYRAYWVVDASIRFKTSDKLAEFHKQAANAPSSLIMNTKTSHSILWATNPGMYKYLPIKKSAAVMTMFYAGIQFHRRSNFVREAMKWYVLCALQEDCMFADKGKEKACQLVPNCDNFGTYAQCHRYDQSAINIILSVLADRDNIPLEMAPKMTNAMNICRRSCA